MTVSSHMYKVLIRGLQHSWSAMCHETPACSGGGEQ